MNKLYDDFRLVSYDTEIMECKDGWYSFKETIFYGEKGGMLSDKGTINGLEVVDLKWEEDVLWHKVEGELSNPIHMEVDLDTRYLNTSVQTAFHIIDGYYRKMGLVNGAVGVNPDNQWFEVHSKDLDATHFEELQAFMNDVIRQDIPVEFQYMKGSEYPDPEYAKFDEVRIVKIGNLDIQPCGTLHLNNTNQIESFVILDFEKTSRGTRVYTTVNQATNKRFKETDSTLKALNKILGVGKHDPAEIAEELVQSHKAIKKELEEAKKELISYKAKELLSRTEKVITLENVSAGDLRAYSQSLATQLTSTKVLIVPEDDKISFSIVSPDGNARSMMDALKEKLEVSGGGSPQIVSGKTLENLEALLTAFENL